MTAPRILWLPHTPWEHCQGQRPQFLVAQVARRLDVHVVTWASRPLEAPGGKAFYLDPRQHLRALQEHSEGTGNPYVHQIGIPLPIWQGLWRVYPPSWMVAGAQIRFQRAIRRLHDRWGFSAIVTSPSHHFTGYPPTLAGIPYLFDYLDAAPHPVEETYVRQASSIVTVSGHLEDQLLARYHRASAVIPNGLDVARIRAGNGRRARQKWGIAGKRVISLIGLTCSPRLYFLDAIAALLPDFPDLVFVAAGRGGIASAIAARAAKLGIPTVMTGWVDPAEVPDLFAASDVGLYPGDDNAYFDGACPLKILEYTGARVPVVANQAAELQRLQLSSCLLRPAEAGAFADGIREALVHPPSDFPDMTAYDWSTLGAAFAREVEAVLERGVRA